MTDTEVDKRNLVAQWAWDTRPVLLRFHLWLEDVELDRSQAQPVSAFTFTPRGIARCLAMTSAATALGTRLFGDFGAGVGKDKATYNQIKNKPGLYEHRNGHKILVVFSTDTKIVQDTGVRTGYTRTGQAMYDINEARLRKTVNDHGPDGDAQWREYRGEPLVLANG